MDETAELEQLRANLDSPSAILAVLKLGKVALDTLIEALNDENPKVRGHAAWLLSKIPDERAVEPLLASVGDKNRFVRQMTVEALGSIHSSQTIDALTKLLLHDFESLVRSWTADALSKFKDDRVVEPLIQAMQNDPEPEVRRLAAFALRTTKDSRALEPLINALQDPAEIVGIWARYALDEFGERARPYLHKLYLEEPEVIDRTYNTIKWEAVEKARYNQYPELKTELENMMNQLNIDNRVEAAKGYWSSKAHNCPICGKAANDLSWFFFYTSPETWQASGGTAGWMTVCDDCHIQVDYFGGINS
jgi:HEAT repeat protein